MASIVTYWRLPEEEDQFLTYLAKTGDIQACVFKSVPHRDLLQPRPLRKLIETDDPDRVVFAQREFISDSWIGSGVHLDGSVGYSRHYSDGPLICYSRGKFIAPNELSQSNLCFVSSCWVSDGANPDLDHSRPQPPEFLSWARNVLNWVRRHTRPHGYYRATSGVLSAVEDGLELEP